MTRSSISPGERRPLPMTRTEMTARGWDACDIILVTGDAYVDHPSFGAALIGRFMESLGYRVGIIARPDCRSEEAFAALGAPRLFWGVTAGNLDSNLARLTVMRKRRRDDPYAPGGKSDERPPNASIVYTSRVRQVARGIPVILGGIEASLRRFAYYDYWTECVKRSLLLDAKADLIVYGMAERALAEVADHIKNGKSLHAIPGTVEVAKSLPTEGDIIELPSFEEVSPPTPEGKAAFARMARLIHEHSENRGKTLVQRHGERLVLIHPPATPLTPEELDAVYNLPFTRQPHPLYGNAPIPAYAMIRDSITTHRGCYGGCSFCAISAHQGRTIISRSPSGILNEVERVVATPGFHGTISDLGGPTANMYGTGCRRNGGPCARKECLFPTVCANLSTDQRPAVNLLRQAKAVPGVRHVFVASGIRYDLALCPGGEEYLKAVICDHTGGRMKIAPEHLSPHVLKTMRKPDPGSYRKFLHHFQAIAGQAQKPPQLIQYFISGHPGCTLRDMVELALELKRAHVQPEQVQDFYPVPLSLAAAMYYTGVDPLTGIPVHVARTDREKALQRSLLLCHLPEFQRKARTALREAGRSDLIGHGPKSLVPPGPFG